MKNYISYIKHISIIANEYIYSVQKKFVTDITSELIIIYSVKRMCGHKHFLKTVYVYFYICANTIM